MSTRTSTISWVYPRSCTLVSHTHYIWVLDNRLYRHPISHHHSHPFAVSPPRLARSRAARTACTTLGLCSTPAQPHTTAHTPMTAARCPLISHFGSTCKSTLADPNSCHLVNFGRSCICMAISTTISRTLTPDPIFVQLAQPYILW